MKTLSAAACALLVAFACANAEAGSRDDAYYLPQLNFEIDLPGHAGAAPHVTASLGLRSNLELVDTASDATGDTAFAAGGTGHRSRHLFVPMLQLGATTQGIDMARVLGRNALDDPRTAAAGTESSGSRGWLWWTAGGLATVAVIALAAGGGGNETNENNCRYVDPDPSSGGVVQGCNVP